MATVKLSDGKVVTKDGKVSCECCDVECCMYPAEELHGLYTVNDLPTELYVQWEPYFTGTVNRSGAVYSGGSITLQIVGLKWRLTSGDNFRNVGRCLIRGDGNVTPGDDLVEDLFPDSLSYEAIKTNPLAWDNPDPFSGTFTRTGLCTWEDLETISEWFGVPPAFAASSLSFSQDAQQFVPSTNVSQSYQKQGDHNDPLGTYIYATGTDLEVVMTVT